MRRILVVDDEKNIRELLTILLRREGWEVETCGDVEEAFRALERRPWDVVVTDIVMPGGSGLDLLRQVRREAPETPVIMITAHAKEVKDAVAAMQEGASDYITKTFAWQEELLLRIRRALEKKSLEEENISLKSQFAARFGKLVGNGTKMQEIFALIRRVADTESRVLITGESGTGKEMVAREIHENSRRRKRPFLTINCGAMPENLLESELFGHVRGAFTGATVSKAGLFEVADGGTLFLDEIAETSPGMQAKLLRVLQDGRIRRVGGTEELPTDVRILAATNQDLEARVREGTFREDLYYRINVIQVHLPPLRDRREDIPELAQRFLEVQRQKVVRPIHGFAPEAMECLERYDWPGNIRELQNVVERAVALDPGPLIGAASLPGKIRARAAAAEAGGGPVEFFARREAEPIGVDEYVEEIRRRVLAEALARAGGNLTKAAELAGITFRSFRYYVDKYSLQKK